MLSVTKDLLADAGRISKTEFSSILKTAKGSRLYMQSFEDQRRLNMFSEERVHFWVVRLGVG